MVLSKWLDSVPRWGIWARLFGHAAPIANSILVLVWDTKATVTAPYLIGMMRRSG